MVKKTKRFQFQFGLKACYVLSAIIFLLSSFLVYFFSNDSKVKVIACTGNYYYSDQEILRTAHVGTQTRLWLTPMFMVSDAVETLPLIDSVQIHRSGGKLEIDVQEKTVIGYYVQDDSNYVLTSKGESLKINEEDLMQIVHFPLLSGFDEKQLKNIARQFQEHKKELSRDVIEKMAEIIPYESSYDKNMLQITMQDGNKVYTTLESLYMITNYSSMLNQLEGKNVCLVLDKDNSAIEKINCDQLSGNKPKEETEKESEEEQETQDTSQKEDTEETTSQQEEQPETETGNYIDKASDWQTDPNFGLQYSASLNLYYDPGTGTYYQWNDTTLSFDVVN